MSLNLHGLIKSELRAIGRAMEAGCSGTEREWEEIYQQIKTLGVSAIEDMASEKCGYRIESSNAWSCRDCGVVQSVDSKKCCSCGRPFKRRSKKSSVPSVSSVVASPPAS